MERVLFHIRVLRLLSVSLTTCSSLSDTFTQLESLDGSDSQADNEGESTPTSNKNKYQMKAPAEDDFDYIKQISNGAYG